MPSSSSSIIESSYKLDTIPEDEDEDSSCVSGLDATETRTTGEMAIRNARKFRAFLSAIFSTEDPSMLTTGEYARKWCCDDHPFLAYSPIISIENSYSNPVVMWQARNRYNAAYTSLQKTSIAADRK
jgi:hypothetical protein